MGSARLRFSGEVKETPAPPPLIQLTDELPQELRGLPEPVLIQMLTPVEVIDSPSVPTLVEKQQQKRPIATPPTTLQPNIAAPNRLSTPPPPSPPIIVRPPTTGPQMNQPNTPQPGTAPTQQTGTRGTTSVILGPDGKEIIGVGDDHISIIGASVPYALAVQVGITAVATALAVSIANTLSSRLHNALNAAFARMMAKPVAVKNDPLSKLTNIFVDSRPKVVVRRVKKPGGSEVIMFEEFDGSHVSTLLEMRELKKGKVHISDIREVLETISPSWRVDLNVRIDSELTNYLDSDERALWKEYFKKYSRLFRGVR